MQSDFNFGHDTPTRASKGAGDKSATRASAAPAFQPTAEQEAVRGCDLSKGQLVLIDAFAGAGKTSTFVLLSGARPQSKFLYICYNKELADSARTRFGRNVDCKTSHALAYGKVGFQYRHKLGNLRAVDVRDEMNLPDTKAASTVLESVNNFLCNAHAEMTVDHMTGPLDGRAQILPHAKKLWARMCDTSDRMQISHDAYLKLWVLSRPDLSAYDVILLDEGQDANPLLLSLVLTQWKQKTCSVVIVGDRHQSIYAFRKASNAMEFCDAHATQRYKLSESFRFPQLIADQANAILSTFKREQSKLLGRGDGKHPVGPAAFLSRTNGGLMERAIEAVQRRKKINFAATSLKTNWSPFIPYKFGEMLDVMHHIQGNRHQVRTPFLQRFRSFAEITEAIEGEGGDPELKAMVDVATRYSTALPYVIKDITDACVAPEEADICFSSGHRSKGKEWAQTELNMDFLPIHDPVKLEKLRKDKGRVAFEQEANLLYVALTRTRSKVTLPPHYSMWFDQHLGVRRAA